MTPSEQIAALLRVDENGLLHCNGCFSHEYINLRKWQKFYRVWCDGCGADTCNYYEKKETAIQEWNEMERPYLPAMRQMVRDIQELRATAEFYRNGFTSYKQIPSMPGFAWKPTEELLDDCGNKASEILETTKHYENL